MIKRIIFSVFVIVLFNCIKSEFVHYYDKICGNSETKRVYVQSEEITLIVGTNNVNNKNNKASFGEHCRLELVSCPACIVSLKFKYLNFTQNCVSNSELQFCNCDYVWIYEPLYESTSVRHFCGFSNNGNESALFYRSKTKNVVITFFNKNNYHHLFALQYVAERNRQIIQGYPDEKINNSAVKIISTPFFPQPYLKDLNMEFVINCRMYRNCKISIIFTDFLISKTSVLEFLDWKGRRLEIATGLSFRPHVIVGSSPFVTVRFYANGVTNKGFKAEVYFSYSKDYKKKSIGPNMDCGGLVDNLGGTISMVNVIKKNMEPFDCVWIIQPARNFLHFYTHLYVKVVEFSNFAEIAELYIHEGVTSADSQKELLKFPFNFNLKTKEHIVPIFQGIYIRFKGILQSKSKLIISYTSVSYEDCILGTDFTCRNERCIPLYLHCNGYDHCGDNSDEPVSCFGGRNVSKWTAAPNFFFPNNDLQDADICAATVMFIMCCFGLTLLIFIIAIVIFRTNGRLQYQREMQNHWHVINDLLDQEVPTAQEEIIIEDDPPDYEAPPTYDEAEGKAIFSIFAEQKNIQKQLTNKACGLCVHQQNNSQSTAIRQGDEDDFVNRHLENNNQARNVDDAGVL